MLTICYRLKKPVVYNQGTKWEKRHSDFLECEVNGDMAFAERLLHEKMAHKPEEVDYYYIHEQEPMLKGMED